MGKVAVPLDLVMVLVFVALAFVGLTMVGWRVLVAGPRPPRSTSRSGQG